MCGVHITSLFTCAYISVNRFRFPLKTRLPNVSRQVGVNLSRANVKYMSFDCGASGATIKRALSKQALKRRALSRKRLGLPFRQAIAGARGCRKRPGRSRLRAFFCDPLCLFQYVGRLFLPGILITNGIVRCLMCAKTWPWSNWRLGTHALTAPAWFSLRNATSQLCPQATRQARLGPMRCSK